MQWAIIIVKALFSSTQTLLTENPSPASRFFHDAPLKSLDEASETPRRLDLKLLQRKPASGRESLQAVGRFKIWFLFQSQTNLPACPRHTGQYALLTILINL